MQQQLGKMTFQETDNRVVYFGFLGSLLTDARLHSILISKPLCPSLKKQRTIDNKILKWHTKDTEKYTYFAILQRKLRRQLKTYIRACTVFFDGTLSGIRLHCFLRSHVTQHIWAASSDFGTYRLCEQRRFR